MRTLTITRPDDWHVHLRDGDYLSATVRDISRYFGRAIVMPNLVPPVSDVDQAREYRDRIVSLVPDNSCFSPLMTLYLTDEKAIGAVQRVGFENSAEPAQPAIDDVARFVCPERDVVDPVAIDVSCGGDGDAAGVARVDPVEYKAIGTVK